ncbi:MAG: ATP-binding protein [Candidatus Sedimenticola sp. 1PA]
MNKEAKLHEGGGLIDKIGASDTLDLDSTTESAWIEVIHKMDSVYADLVHYQVELEEKNLALEDAHKFIQSVQSAMTDVLIVCDVQGRIEEVNKALEVLTGKTQKELVGKPFGILFGNESQSLVAQFPDKIRSDTIVDCEVSLLDGEGVSAPLAMNCSSRFDHDGRLVGMVIIGRPVGELRRAYDELNKAHQELQQTQQQLVQSEKMASLGRLVAGVAHELNNPISFVFGNMHALKRYGQRITRYISAIDSKIPPEELMKLRQELKIDAVMKDIGSLIDGTMEGAERVSDIVQDLRRYSGAQKELPGVVDLPRVIETAVHWVSKAARIKPNVEYDLPGHFEVTTCKGQLHQILVNLVQNAVDVLEGREDAKIVVGCSQENKHALITVRDNGPGISDDPVTRVFDPFFTSKPVGEGTGLGLYISYGLAADLGGELTVANHPDSGAQFTLKLPMEPVK